MRVLDNNSWQDIMQAENRLTTLARSFFGLLISILRDKMDLVEKWDKAIQQTKILRSRLRSLLAFETTELPYGALGSSSVNPGDTVVRKGKVVVHKPLLLLPSRFLPQFEGFDFEEDYQVDGGSIRRFFLMRGVSFPSLKYCNDTHTVDVFEGYLEKAVDYFSREMEKREDVHCGLMLGPEDCWQFSVIIYVASLAVRSLPGDLEKLLDAFQ